MRATAYNLDASEIDQLSLPAILYWDRRHFVVCARAKRGRVFIHDPASDWGHWIPLNAAVTHFSGIAMEFKKCGLVGQVRQTSKLRALDLTSYLTGHKKLIAGIIVASVLIQALSFLPAYYIELVVDRAIKSHSLRQLDILSVGFGIVAVATAASSLLRSMASLHLARLTSIDLSSDIAWHMMRLPLEWFQRRGAGNILSKFQSLQPVRQCLSEGVISTTLDGILAIASVILLFAYSLDLTLLTLCALAIHLCVRSLGHVRRRSFQVAAINAAAREQSLFLESLRGIATLRVHNRERQRFELWQSKFKDAMHASSRLGRSTAIYKTASGTVLGLEAVLAVWIGAHKVIDGSMSVGMLYAFVAFKTQLTQRVTAFCDQIANILTIQTHVDRVGDITGADIASQYLTSRSSRSLQGSVELQNVSFRFSDSDPYLFKSLSVRIEPGEHVVIKGPSGCGKSTLLKIIAGLIRPTSGSVLIDGLPLDEFGHSNLYEQTGFVFQDDSVFAGSISDNVALYDKAKDESMIRTAIELASLSDDVRLMPMGIETPVGDLGCSLSGGQRQRVLLARALYKVPRILMIDEGTSSLDDENENVINRSISQLKMTRIVVAHRSGAIESADRVLTW